MDDIFSESSSPVGTRLERYEKKLRKTDSEWKKEILPELIVWEKRLQKTEPGRKRNLVGQIINLYERLLKQGVESKKEILKEKDRAKRKILEEKDKTKRKILEENIKLTEELLDEVYKKDDEKRIDELIIINEFLLIETDKKSKKILERIIELNKEFEKVDTAEERSEIKKSIKKELVKLRESKDDPAEWNIRFEMRKLYRQLSRTENFSEIEEIKRKIRREEYFLKQEGGIEEGSEVEEMRKKRKKIISASKGEKKKQLKKLKTDAKRTLMTKYKFGRVIRKEGKIFKITTSNRPAIIKQNKRDTVKIREFLADAKEKSLGVKLRLLKNLNLESFLNKKYLENLKDLSDEEFEEYIEIVEEDDSKSPILLLEAYLHSPELIKRLVNEYVKEGSEKNLEETKRKNLLRKMKDISPGDAGDIEIFKLLHNYGLAKATTPDEIRFREKLMVLSEDDLRAIGKRIKKGEYLYTAEQIIDRYNKRGEIDESDLTGLPEVEERYKKLRKIGVSTDEIDDILGGLKLQLANLTEERDGILDLIKKAEDLQFASDSELLETLNKKLDENNQKRIKVIGPISRRLYEEIRRRQRGTKLLRKGEIQLKKLKGDLKKLKGEKGKEKEIIALQKLIGRVQESIADFDRKRVEVPESERKGMILGPPGKFLKLGENRYETIKNILKVRTDDPDKVLIQKIRENTTKGLYFILSSIGIDQEFIQELERIIFENSNTISEYYNKISLFTVLLTDLRDYVITFINRLHEGLYSPWQLANSSFEELIPEIYDNEEVNQNDKDLVRREVETLVVRESYKMAETLYVSVTNARAYGMTPKEIGLDREIFQKDRLEPCHDFDRTVNKPWNVVTYEENGTLYCFSIFDIVHNFYNDDYNNPETGNRFSDEFLKKIENYDFIRVQNAESAELFGEDYEDEEDLLRELADVVAEPEIAPGFLDILNNFIEKAEKEGESESESESESSFPNSSEDDEEKDKEDKEEEDKEEEDKEDKEDYNDDEKVECLECKTMARKGDSQRSVMYEGKDPTIVSFCSFECFEKRNKWPKKSRKKT